jgi:prephenate dehydrogenase
MIKLGLIGFGRFGRLLYNQLKNSADIQVFDSNAMSDFKNESIPFTELPDVCKREYIILATPVSQLEQVCTDMKPHLSDRAVIMDVCAVKTYPSQIMKTVFNSSVQILGTHPLFGPDSVQESMQGHLMIISPYRISAKNLNWIKDFWQSFGIKLIEMTPDEQDRLMAWTLAMTHFLGRSLTDLPLPETTIATRDYRNLIELMRKINRDTWELFEDMHRFNPYTEDMRRRLLESMQHMKEKLDKLQMSDSLRIKRIK